MARRQILLVGNKQMPQLEKNCAVRTHIFLPKEMFASVAFSSPFVTLATLKT